MKVTAWMNELENLAPLSCACDWDNPGLLAGRTEKEVKKILIALDGDDDAVDLAVSEGVDLLITHHPLIFRPVKSITDQDFLGRRLLKLMGNDISLYAMHTNFDAAPGCMADLAAGKLHLVESAPLEVMGERDGVPYGIGKSGILLTTMTLRQLAEHVKKEFGLPFVRVYGGDQPDETVRRVAVCPGSGGDLVKAALAAESEVLITGDIGHHTGTDAASEGLSIIDAGHYGLEHIFVDFMADYCRERIDSRVEIIKAPVHFPSVSW